MELLQETVVEVEASAFDPPTETLEHATRAELRHLGGGGDRHLLHAGARQALDLAQT